jgi:hypothetical protein
MNTGLLNNIAFDIVKDKVIEDKLKEAEVEQKKEQQSMIRDEKPELEDDNQFPDIDDPDSEEERIMQKELSKMKENADNEIEKEKQLKLRKYGQYREIVEDQFLDTMLKNEDVVCHFYHPEFERCKIMDKHLINISEVHHETLFVKINAEKTPFFTNKLQVKVKFNHYKF